MSKFAAKELTLKGRAALLREAIPEDAPMVLEFLTSIAEETPFTYNYPGQSLKPETLAKRLKAEFEAPTQLRLLALEGGRVIAQLGLWRHSPDHPWLKHKAEFAMMVVKDWWGSGLASELLQAMEAFARETQVSRIEATVNCSNTRGIRLYEKHGFVIEGTAKRYKIVDGEAFDSYFIAKLF